MDTENVSDKLNAEEKEYLDELKECLADNAQISPMERRLLDKFRDMVIKIKKKKILKVNLQKKEEPIIILCGVWLVKQLYANSLGERYFMVNQVNEILLC